MFRLGFFFYRLRFDHGFVSCKLELELLSVAVAYNVAVSYKSEEGAWDVLEVSVLFAYVNFFSLRSLLFPSQRSITGLHKLEVWILEVIFH